MLWRYFKSKEALTVILWHMIIEASLASIPYTSIAIAWDIVLLIMFFFYPVFGMVADDVRCGRLETIIIGTWITWVGAISVAIYIASTEHMTSSLIIMMLWSMQLVGAGIFQANVLQFGIDQLQDEQHSCFVYWYIWTQEISGELYGWVKDGATSIMPSHTPLVMLLTVITLLSSMLCIIPWFKSHWEFKTSIKVSNPYVLIYRVLSFAWTHKHRVKRIMEDQKPSKIELGDRKYGGYFNHYEIEDVKALFRIAKLLLLLIGFFICRNGFNIVSISFNVSYTQELTFRGILTAAIFISLPLHELLYPCIKARYPGDLTRTSIGAVLSLLVNTAILLYDIVGHTTNDISGAGSYALQWFYMPMMLCKLLGYLIFTTSLLEFVVTKSPQSMRGSLIGMYYCFGYGLSQAAAWLLYLPFKGQDHRTSFHNGTAYLTLVTALGIASVAAFIQAAHNFKYKTKEPFSQPKLKQTTTQINLTELSSLNCREQTS